ncbi:hypothetical protein KUCAC02_029856, partial [Chaenocephalus aceratus]
EPSATAANVLLVLLSVFTNRAAWYASCGRWGGGTRHSEHLCSPRHSELHERLHLNVSNSGPEEKRLHRTKVDGDYKTNTGFKVKPSL